MTPKDRVWYGIYNYYCYVIYIERCYVKFIVPFQWFIICHQNAVIFHAVTMQIL